MAINFPNSPAINQTVVVGTDTWFWNGLAWEVEPVTLIPTQTGQSGKYLTTNGTAVSWGTITATAASVGLGNVTNESKATMFASPAFTGNVGINVAGDSQYSLTVNGIANIRDLYMNQNTGAGVVEHNIYMDSAAGPTTVKFTTNGTNYINSGNVYIGSNSALGGALLTVNGRVYATSLVLGGSTSGTVTFAAGATPQVQTYTLPAAYPAANGYALTSTTAGVLTWAAPASGTASEIDLSAIMEDVSPVIDGVYDIGSSTNSWYNLYLTNSLFLGEDISATADETITKTYSNRDVVTTEVGPDVFTSSANMTFTRDSHGGAGTQNAALAFSGQFNGSTISTSEEYNGTSWSSGGSMMVAYADMAGGGSQAAAFASGGNVIGFGIADNGYQVYDGTNWSYGPAGGSANNNGGRFDHAATGEQNSILIFGGYDSSYSIRNSSEECNGTSWSSGGNMVYGRATHAGCGSQNATLAAGGADNGSNGIPGEMSGSSSYRIYSTEEYNGTSWSVGGNLIVARSKMAMSGEQTAARIYGGYATSQTNSYGGPTNSTEVYDGTAWSTSSLMLTAAYNNAAAGSTSAGLTFGGDGISGSPSTLNTTEEVNPSIITTTTVVTDEFITTEPLLTINTDISAKDIFGSSLVLDGVAIVDNVITPLDTPLYGQREIIVDGGVTVSSTDATYLKLLQLPIKSQENVKLDQVTLSWTGGELGSPGQVHSYYGLYPFLAWEISDIEPSFGTGMWFIITDIGTQGGPSKAEATQLASALKVGEEYTLEYKGIAASVPLMYYERSFYNRIDSVTVTYLGSGVISGSPVLKFSPPSEPKGLKFDDYYGTSQPTLVVAEIVLTPVRSQYVKPIIDYSVLDTFGSEGMLRYNPVAKGFEGHNGTEWGPIGGAPGVTSLKYSTATFVSTSGNTQFTIAQGRTVDDILVFVNGICFTPGDDYTVTGNSLSLVDPPGVNAEITVRYLPI